MEGRRMRTTNPRDVVIWSADVDEPTLDRALSNSALPLQFVKIDRLGLTRMGLDKIDVVQFQGFKVFADAKIAEIPDKIVELAKLHLAHHPWMLNVMAGVCSTGRIGDPDTKKVDALKRFADVCRDVGTRPCAVTVLTSKDEPMVAREFNGRTPIDQVLVYTEMLIDAGFTDMVCSAKEAVAIRDEPAFDLIQLNTPGIRLPGSSADDQARITTPFGAISAGVDRLVIGRDLTKGDLVRNWNRINANLNP